MTLRHYFGGIDSRHWTEAYAADGGGGYLQQFAHSYSTTHDADVVVHSMKAQANGDVTVILTFVSHQAPSFAPNRSRLTCVRWNLEYRLTPSSGGPLAYIISGARGVTTTNGWTRC